MGAEATVRMVGLACPPDRRESCLLYHSAKVRIMPILIASWETTPRTIQSRFWDGMRPSDQPVSAEGRMHVQSEVFARGVIPKSFLIRIHYQCGTLGCHYTAGPLGQYHNGYVPAWASSKNNLPICGSLSLNVHTPSWPRPTVRPNEFQFRVLQSLRIPIALYVSCFNIWKLQLLWCMKSVSGSEIDRICYLIVTIFVISYNVYCLVVKVTDFKKVCCVSYQSLIM